MGLSFGVTVLPDPPYSRFLELIQHAESNGFEYGWTYDSHVLWQESFPLLTLAVQATSTMKFGHCVTNPGTREPTVLASGYATLHDISNGRMVMGIGRGDSAVRYIGDKPVRVAEFERRCGMIKEFMNGREVEWNEKPLKLAWVRPELPEIPMWVAGYGPKALAVAGRVGDGVIIQLADPGDHQVDHGHRTRVRRRGGTRPVGAQVHRLRAQPHHRRHRRRARAGALVPGDGVEPRHGPHRALRLRVGDPARAHRVRARSQVLRLRRALPCRREARRVRHRRDLRPLLCPRQRRAGHREAEGARGDRRRPVQHLPHDARPGGRSGRLRQATSSRSSRMPQPEPPPPRRARGGL